MTFSREIEDLVHFSVINVNKPSGMRSNEVDKKIGKIFNVKRVGHAGTLDPKASGVLLVAIDEATKILRFLMESDKEYEGIMYLHRDVNYEKLRSVIDEKFTGLITQIPPLKSRVSRKPRQRKVYFFEVLRKEGKNVFFRTRVEAGTYIRKLVHDIGEGVGCGAHLRYLTRTRSGKFDISNSKTIDEIERAYEKWRMGDASEIKNILIPIEDVLEIPKLKIKWEKILRILKGGPVRRQDIIGDFEIKVGSNVGLFTPEGEMLGLGIVVSNKKVKTDRIFINKKRNI